MREQMSSLFNTGTGRGVAWVAKADDNNTDRIEVVPRATELYFQGAGGTVTSLDPAANILTIDSTGAGTYTWTIEDQAAVSDVVNDTEIVQVVGAGGIVTALVPGVTKVLTIDGSGIIPPTYQWIVIGGSGVAAGVNSADTVAFVTGSNGQTNDGVVPSAVTTVGTTHTIDFKLNASATLNAITTGADGILYFDATAPSAGTPAANMITFSPQPSILTPGVTDFNTTLGTVNWEIQTSADIDFIDGAGNSMMEIDPSGERVTIAKQTAGGIALPAAVSLNTRLITYNAAATCAETMFTTTSASCIKNFGTSGGENNIGAILWNTGGGTTLSGPVRPVTSANLRMQNNAGGGGGGGNLAPWLLQRYTVAGTGNSAGQGDILRVETQDLQNNAGRQTRHVDSCPPFWITYSIMQQQPSDNLNQVLPVNMRWCNGTGPAYAGTISMPATTATFNPIPDFSACCTRFFDDTVMPIGGGEICVFGSRFMNMDTGTGAFRVELSFRIYNRTGTGTEPCIKFQLYTSVTSLLPVWTQSTKTYTVTLEENVAPIGSSSFTSGTAVWQIGMNHGNAMKIMAVREQFATSTDPVYVDGATFTPPTGSTTLMITKIG